MCTLICVIYIVETDLRSVMLHYQIRSFSHELLGWLPPHCRNSDDPSYFITFQHRGGLVLHLLKSTHTHIHTLLLFLLLSKLHSTDNIFILLLVIDIPYFRSALKCTVMCRTHDPQDAWPEFGRNLPVSVFPQAFRDSRKQEEEGLGPAKTDYRLAQNLHLPRPPLFTETGCVLI